MKKIESKQRFTGRRSFLAVVVLAAAFAVSACPQAAEDETGSGTTVNVEDSEVDGTYSIQFNHPQLWFWVQGGTSENGNEARGSSQNAWPYNLTGNDAVIRPAAGYTRRDMSAYIKNSAGSKTNATVKYFVSNTRTGDAATITGIDIKPNGMMHIGHDFTIPSGQDSRSIYVFAESANGLAKTTDADRIQIEIRAKSLITGNAPVDGPVLPKNRKPAGLTGDWDLFFSEEFDTPANTENNRGLSASWSPYYLLAWRTNPTGAAYFDLQDNMLFLTGPRELRPANEAIGSQRISGIQTLHRPFLHYWGQSRVLSREIPVFEGQATKFGYFELRVKLPNTRDGSHFAWWMVGAQDDEHPSVTSATGTSLFTSPYGSYKGWTNQTAEYDLLEQHQNPIDRPSPYLAWSRHHLVQGTNSMEGWSTGTSGSGYFNYATNHIDPYNEFHTYGMEWNEDGMRYYLDDELVDSGPVNSRGANYRMIQILSLYLGRANLRVGDGFGDDRGIYPKDAVVDYLRIYKKREETSKPYSVQIIKAPYNFKVPASGSAKFTMKARVLDQNDREMPDEQDNIRWKFSQTVAGPQRSPRVDDWSIPIRDGVSINATTGEVTVTSSAPVTQDIYVTAYHKNNAGSGAGDNSIPLNRGVFESRHIKLSRASDTGASRPKVIHFDDYPTNRVRITSGQTINVAAKMYDQYGVALSNELTYSIVQEHTGEKVITIPGVSLNGTNLQVNAPAGTAIIVNAKSRSVVYFEGPSGIATSTGRNSPVGGETTGLREYVMGNLIVEVVPTPADAYY